MKKTIIALAILASTFASCTKSSREIEVQKETANIILINKTNRLITDVKVNEVVSNVRIKRICRVDSLRCGSSVNTCVDKYCTDVIVEYSYVRDNSQEINTDRYIYSVENESIVRIKWNHSN